MKTKYILTLFLFIPLISHARYDDYKYGTDGDNSFLLWVPIFLAIYGYLFFSKRNEKLGKIAAFIGAVLGLILIINFEKIILFIIIISVIFLLLAAFLEKILHYIAPYKYTDTLTIISMILSFLIVSYFSIKIYNYYNKKSIKQKPSTAYQAPNTTKRTMQVPQEPLQTYQQKQITYSNISEQCKYAMQDVAHHYTVASYCEFPKNNPQIEQKANQECSNVDLDKTEEITNQETIRINQIFHNFNDIEKQAYCINELYGKWGEINQNNNKWTFIDETIDGKNVYFSKINQGQDSIWVKIQSKTNPNRFIINHMRANCGYKTTTILKGIEFHQNKSIFSVDFTKLPSEVKTIPINDDLSLKRYVYSYICKNDIH